MTNVKTYRRKTLEALYDNQKRLNDLLSIENDILREENEELRRELKKLKVLL